MKLIKNKKGFVTDFIVDFWSFIAFVVILLLFFFIFSTQIGGCNKAREITVVSEGSDIINEKMTLMNYLSSPYDSERTVSELIADSHLTGEYDEFNEFTLEFLDKMDEDVFEDGTCSILCVSEGNDIILEILTDECENEILGEYCQENKMKIPLKLSDEKKSLTIALSYDVNSAPHLIRRNN